MRLCRSQLITASIALLTILIAATMLLLGSPPAQASSCGDGSLAFSGGEGTGASPFLIATEADLTSLRDGYTTTPSYYSCAYRQTADIRLSGTWSHGIGFSTPGSALYKPFEGSYDGDGHSVTDLNIDAQPVVRANQARELGFIGLSTSASSALRNLDLVNAFVNCGYETVFASMLIGQTSGTVERSSATGTVDCRAADGLARMGGLVGYTNGTVANCWVSGTITIPSASTFAPNSVGGVIGRTFSSASVQNLLGRVSVVNASSAIYVGAFAGWSEGTRSSSYSQSGRGVSDIIGAVSPPVNVEFKTAVELQDIATYAGWSISQGISSSTIWGIDPAINGGFPFLQRVRRAVEDSAQTPPSILQQIPALEGGSCAIEEDEAFAYGTNVHGGWVLSSAQWPNGGLGGPVCTRTLTYLGGGWTVTA